MKYIKKFKIFENIDVSLYKIVTRPEFIQFFNKNKHDIINNSEWGLLKEQMAIFYKMIRSTWHIVPKFNKNQYNYKFPSDIMEYNFRGYDNVILRQLGDNRYKCVCGFSSDSGDYNNKTKEYTNPGVFSKDGYDVKISVEFEVEKYEDSWFVVHMHLNHRSDFKDYDKIIICDSIDSLKNLAEYLHSIIEISKSSKERIDWIRKDEIKFNKKSEYIYRPDDEKWKEPN